MDTISNCVVLNTKKLSPTHIERIMTWCNQHFGPEEWKCIMGFPGYHWRFYLPTPEDEVLFRLKWVH